MLKIWFVREGDNPTSENARCKLSHKTFSSIFGGINREYLGFDTPRFPSENPDLNEFREFNHAVVLEVCESLNELKEGFYKLDLSTSECETALKNAGL